MHRGVTSWSNTVLWIAAGCALASAPAFGQSIQVAVQNCASGVHLAVQQARLSEVLRRLSEELGFELQFGADKDPVISTDVTLPPLELVRSLRAAENQIVLVAPDPRCPRHPRLTAVWVIGRGTVSAPLPPLRTAEQIEAEHRAKEATDMYLRAHGMNPDQDGAQ